MKTSTVIAALTILLTGYGARAQVYDQSFFIEKMPQIPTSVIGIDDKEKEMLRTQITSLETYLDSLQRQYKHPMCSIEKASQQEMFEFDRIWEELYRLNDHFLDDYHAKMIAQTELLSKQEYDRQAELSDERRRMRQASKTTMKDISDEENRIDKAMYDNHAMSQQKKADLLTQSIMSYRALIEEYAGKAKRADTILLAKLSSKHNYPCVAIFNAQQLLAMYKGYLELFVPPFSPIFE